MNRTRRAFDYQPPSFEEATKLTEQRRGGRYDNHIKENGPRFFKPKGGDNFIRILPPTWENPKHYAYPIKLHRSIGPDKQTYLCLAENEGSPEKECPICVERWDMLRRKAPQIDTDALRPQASLLVYLIDRANEDQGPMIWGMSNKSDLEILAQSIEKRQQRYLPIVHPIDGYDVEFFREGEGILTRYRGFKVARTSSPVHDNADKLEEWLNYIEENPIPDILQFYPAERIKSVFHGGAPADVAEDEPPTYVRDVREQEVRERVRETRPPLREEPPVAEPHREASNGRDEPPFDVDEAPVERERPSERPAPRDVEPPPAERRRATLSDEGGGDNRRSIEALRARLGARGNGNGNA